MFHLLWGDVTPLTTLAVICCFVTMPTETWILATLEVVGWYEALVFALALATMLALNTATQILHRMVPGYN